MAVRPRRRRKAQVLPTGPLVWRRPWLYPKQERFLYHRARYVVVEASTKTGKTTGCLIWLTEQACLKGAPGRRFWWVAPSYNQARIAYGRFKLWATHGMYEWNDSALSVILPNGAVIEFRTAEKPDLLYGDDVWAVVLDEASRMRAESWHAVRSTLTFTKGPVRIIGNVKGTKNWYYTLARKAQAVGPEGDDTYFYIKLTAWDAVEAGVLDRAEVEDARNNLPDAVFRELYLAEPSDDGGNPFGLRALRENIGRFLAKYPPSGGRDYALSPLPPVIWGVDLASVVDWCVAIGLDEHGDVCRFERWQGPWPATIERLRRLIGDVPCVIDATGVGKPIYETLAQGDQRPALLIDEEARQRAARGDAKAQAFLQEAEAHNAMLTKALGNVIPFVFTPTSRQGILEGLALAIQQHDIGCTAGPGGVLQAELEGFEFVHTNRAVKYAAPDNLHDDCVMALALANEGRRTAATRPSRGGFTVAL